MAPDTTKSEVVLQKRPSYKMEDKPTTSPRDYEIIFVNILTFSYWHLASMYALYLCFVSVKWQTMVWSFAFLIGAVLGISAGAHRLWSHKSFKVNLPLEILIMILNSISFQNTATDWVRNHRLHHRFVDTDADPHNATRGFFYSHIGWLLVRKHPEVLRRGKLIDMTDIYNNPVLRFQKKYAIPFIGAVCFALPTLIPMYWWGESFLNAWHMTVLRYTISLHLTFLVNSAAHSWGYKPYDKNMLAVQNMTVSIVHLGEGFHNYHHVFPWDYRSAELGNDKYNVTAKLIEFFAWLGCAYDLKVVPEDMIRKRQERTGDGTDLWGREMKSKPSTD